MGQIKILQQLIKEEFELQEVMHNSSATSRIKWESQTSWRLDLLELALTLDNMEKELS